MSDTEAALAEMAFVISSMGDKAATILPTISSWFAVSWGIEYSVAYAASATFCSAHLKHIKCRIPPCGDDLLKWCCSKPRFAIVLSCYNSKSIHNHLLRKDPIMYN